MRQVGRIMTAWAALLLLVVGVSAGAGQSVPACPPQAGAVHAIGQTLYVPVYSHIYYGGKRYGGKREYLLAVTLSIRNTDPQKAMLVTSIRYYDTAGRVLEEYLQQPLRLGPLVSTEIFVEEQDIRGGAGTNFLVEWRAEEPINVPLVEAVMVGTSGTQALSFTSPGRVIGPPSP